MTRVFPRHIKVGLTKSSDTPENVISKFSTLFYTEKMKKA